MPALQLTPEQGQLVIGSSEPVVVVIPATQREYVLIAKQTLEDLKKLIPEETAEYRYHDIRDDVPDEP